MRGVYETGKEKEQIEQVMSGIILQLCDVYNIGDFSQLEPIVNAVKSQGGASHYSKVSSVGHRFKELPKGQTNQIYQEFSADFQEMCFNCGIFDGKAVTGKAKLIGFRLFDLPLSVIQDLEVVEGVAVQERKDLSTQKQIKAQALLAGCVTRGARGNSYIAQGNIEEVQTI